MLSDEEKQAIIDRYHNDKSFDMWDAFDAVERAVLAKASQQVQGDNDLAHDVKITVESLVESARCMGALSNDKDAHKYWSDKTEEYRKNVYAIIEAAKAMPAPKQEPDYWKIGGLGGDLITNKKIELDLAERFNWPVEPLYKHPTPSQAAAIPEEMTKIKSLDLIPEIDDDYGSNLFVKGWNDCRAAMLSAAPKPEMVIITNEDYDK